ncbi:MAG: HD-GYP domain-containing protein [Phycisphaerales bacterium]
MLSVPIHSARPGMALALAVDHPEHPGHVLLRPGFVLDRPSIERLDDLGVPLVWIAYPGLESVLKYINPAVISQHAALAATLGEALDPVARRAGADLAFKDYARAIRGLIQKLSEQPASQVLVRDIVGRNAPLVAHSSNVCFLSLLLGLKLDGYFIQQRARLSPNSARNVENLGIGALLHDCGVLDLPRAVIDRYTQTGDEADPAWQEHVRLGYERVHGSVDATASSAVLQHHQRFDGRGYPEVARPGTPSSARPLAGAEIHVFARVIAVADLYDRFRARVSSPETCVGPADEEMRGARTGTRWPVVRVLKRLLLESRRRGIDPIVFKALLHVVPAFCPGTIVQLNTGITCVVSQHHPLRPCRPCVRPVFRTVGVGGRADEQVGPEIDLRLRRDLWVAWAEGQSVATDLFEAGEPTEFDLRVLQPPRFAFKPTAAAA